MEVDENTKIYHDSLLNYVDYTFNQYLSKRGIDSMDLCITGMMINMLAYAHLKHDQLNLMIDYILRTSMNDGGWNCMKNHVKTPKISSVHTTINVLEGLAEYIKKGYTYRKDEVINSIDKAIKCLLSRHLIYVKGTNQPIHESIANHHYPVRWKYDYLRILEFLAKYHYPLTIEMKECLDLLINHLKRGKLSKGSQISGLTYFPIEDSSLFGRFNTLRAYIVLKEYNRDLFEKLSQEEL
jgi:hypothetical protein